MPGTTKRGRRQRTGASVTIGQRIRFARKEAGLTQAQVAGGLGVSRVSVTQWESGDTTPEREHVRKLAVLLRRQPEFLEFGLEISPEQRLQFRRAPLLDWTQVCLDGSIFVDPDVTPAHSRYVVALVRGEPMLRQYIDEGARRYLVASNPAVPDRIITVDDDVKIVGVVVFRGARV